MAQREKLKTPLLKSQENKWKKKKHKQQKQSNIH